MIRIANPFFRTNAQRSRETNAAKNAPLIDAWMRTQSSNKVVSLGEIKAGIPAIAAELDRETMNMIVQQLGLVVVNPEDTDP